MHASTQSETCEKRETNGFLKMHTLAVAIRAKKKRQTSCFPKPVMGGFGVFLVLSFIHCTSLSEFCRPLRQTASFFFFQSYLNARQSSTISLLKNKSRIVPHCNNLLTEKCKNYWSLFSVADTQVQCILVACLGCPCKAKPAEQNLSPISTYRTALLSLTGTLERSLPLAKAIGLWNMDPTIH